MVGVLNLLLVFAERNNPSKVGSEQSQKHSTKGDHGTDDTSLGDVETRAAHGSASRRLGLGSSGLLKGKEVGVGSGDSLSLR